MEGYDSLRSIENAYFTLSSQKNLCSLASVFQVAIIEFIPPLLKSAPLSIFLKRRKTRTNLRTYPAKCNSADLSFLDFHLTLFATTIFSYFTLPTKICSALEGAMVAQSASTTNPKLSLKLLRRVSSVDLNSKIRKETYF